MDRPRTPLKRLLAWRRGDGLTLIELLMAVALLAVLLSIAIAQYEDFVERARVNEAVTQLRAIEVTIQGFMLLNGRYPEDLAEIGKDTVRDPWDGPIYYRDLTGPGNGGARKDRRLNPLNSDFDLFSAGKDGDFRTQITHAKSLDDVIRARDGQFLDLAERF
jgi:general secretion pathway protein G